MPTTSPTEDAPRAGMPEVPPGAADLARDLLERAGRWLEEEARAGRHHPPLTRDVGGLGKMIGHDGLVADMRKLLVAAPVHSFPSIRASDPDSPAPVSPSREIPEVQAITFDYPPYEDAWVRSYLGNFEDPHVSQALAGADEEAQAGCATELDWEEYLAMVAFRGDHQRALDALDARQLPRQRCLTPRMVVAVETCRAGDHAFSRRVLDDLIEDCAAWDLVQLAAGYLGRVPWNGYPLPDY